MKSGLVLLLAVAAFFLVCLLQSSEAKTAHKLESGDEADDVITMVETARRRKHRQPQGEDQRVICDYAYEGGFVNIKCPKYSSIKSINFASYGTPNVVFGCANFQADSSCHSSNSYDITAKNCLNQNSCTLAANRAVFGDPCYGVHPKRLGVVAVCSRVTPNEGWTAAEASGRQ
eukprot:gnl/Hemi2/3637_TR1266_c0_g2_i1.p1 gnl/Hemi2/3637_TR1266_c0_g2~~gnl/Hemi2/3637_TR1266_c0_g2_i1.p1  ORF type:complete len:183 (+),score=61.92 gnl/Hemi2/3637_TR1266_c0_g2_i1:30-551(+)